jgi:hypothetical protein
MHALLEAPAPEDEGRTLSDSVPDETRAGWVAALRAVRERRNEQDKATARLYYRSLQLYHAGRLREARAGFEQLLRQDAVLEPVREMAQRYLTEIDNVLAQPPEPEY